MSAALKSIVRSVVPRSMLDWRSNRIAARKHSQMEGLPLAAKFDHIYKAGLWGRGTDGAMSSGDGTRDQGVVAPYIAAVAEVLAKLPAGRTLVDIGAGDFSVGVQLLPLVAKYVACDISAVIVEQNRKRYSSEPNVEFRVLDAAEDSLPAADVVTIRQVLQHLSNDQITCIVPKLSAYAAIIITESVPADPDFVPNADHRSGFSTRVIESNSAVDLAVSPFNLPHVEARILCEPLASTERTASRIRTTLYVTEKGRALGL